MLGASSFNFEVRKLNVIFLIILLFLAAVVNARDFKSHVRSVSKSVVSIECMGRLGNQLFQYSAVMGIAKSYPHTHACILCDDVRMWEGILPQPKKCNPDLIQNQPVFNEAGVATYDSSFTKHEKNAVGFRINGYMQSFKYLDSAGFTFTFETHIKLKARNYLDKWTTRNTVGFHVRRTDMLLHTDSHIMVPDSFYARAISHFQEKFGTDYVVLVISDDMEWCRTQPFFKQPRVFMADEFTETVESLALMAQCEHHVVTIGTFGWWGAWLGTKAHSITLYHNEFVMTHPNRVNSVKLDDYYPPRWIEIV
jgi:galactoside 2-L-fucosyltransferase 1/2